jgi:hypothetical protein
MSIRLIQGRKECDGTKRRLGCGEEAEGRLEQMGWDDGGVEMVGVEQPAT